MGLSPFAYCNGYLLGNHSVFFLFFLKRFSRNTEPRIRRGTLPKPAIFTYCWIKTFIYFENNGFGHTRQFRYECYDRLNRYDRRKSLKSTPAKIRRTVLEGLFHYSIIIAIEQEQAAGGNLPTRPCLNNPPHTLQGGLYASLSPNVLVVHL
jgi:hypothetical protein